MFKYIHAADVHLDSPLRGLERYESAPVDAVRGACRRAFQKMVELAIDEEVAFVLLAGDVYDGDWKDYKTGLFFVEQTAKLREAGIEVCVVAGNHDAESKLTKALRLPDNVRMFSTKRPETHVIERCDVAVHGQGYATRDVTTDLAAAYPAADAGLFNIGLLHTCLTGRDGHANYAPTTVAGLERKGYQYWALGHVHEREIVGRDPWIVFPGNVQGRHIRETGPKGCTLVTVDGGVVRSVEERRLDVMRWSRCVIDLGRCPRTDDVLEAVERAITAASAESDGPLAVRVELAGASPCHDALAARPDHWTQEIRALGAVAQQDVWIERVKLSTRPVAARGGLGTAGLSSLGLGADAEPTAEDLTAYRAALDDVRKFLPSDVEDALPIDEDEFLSELASEARALLAARLKGGAS